METEQAYLDERVKDNAEVTLFLANGVKLVGKISGHTERVLFLQRGQFEKPQMVYKHAISTVMPQIVPISNPTVRSTY